MFKNLDTPPSASDINLWTDFVELRAVVHPDRCFSKGDFSGVARRAQDLGRGFNAETKWKMVTDMVNIRAKAFSAAYPFKLSTDVDTVELDFDEGAQQTSYLGLLIAACLRNIADEVRGDVARAFEEASVVVFSKLMPVGSVVRATYAAGGPGVPYTGLLFNKLNQLALDLRCIANFDAADFKPTDVGDGGIDMVAWHPMYDSRQGIPIAFAQCGCSTTDWEWKQLSPHPAKYRSKLPVMHPWANYYFMPLDFRRLDGDWENKSDLAEVIMVDRLRLLRIAISSHAIDDLPTMEYVAEALVANYA